jgi:uncharacterized protein GlcG (DUF336 family)
MENFHSIQSVSCRTGMFFLDAAVSWASDQGLLVAIAVADPQGTDICSVRMDGVSPPILDFARDKAFTAATMRRDTEAFAARMNSKESLKLGFSTRQRLISWGGGVPIFAAGSCIGALGVSGAQDHEDIACARYTITQAGLAFEL